MFFRLVYDPVLAQAAYIIGCQKTKEALVVDPQRDIERYVEIAQANGLRITAATETHIHADFLSGCRELAEQYGVKLYLSDEGDADWKYGWIDDKSGGGRYDVQLLHDGDTFTIGNIEIKAVHTPGHTPEHISFVITDRGGNADAPMGVCSGDFVFVGDVGRPDLLETAAGVAGTMDASARRLAASAKQFLDMPEYLQLWPGHGAGSACGKSLGAVPQSTIGYEKRFNPALKLANNENAFVDYVLEGQPEPPMYFGRMKVQNRDGVPPLGKLPTPKRLSAKDAAALDGKKVAVIDTRPWPAFRDGHLPGSLFAPLSAMFPTSAGSYVTPEEDVYLVVNEDDADLATRCCVRIGLDRVRGFITPNVLASMPAQKLEKTPEIDVIALRQRMDGGQPFVLDVRRATEHATACIPGTTNIAHTRLPERLDELPKDQPILVHCQSGMRSAFATSMLRRRGYDATNVAGGFKAWSQAAQPVAH